MISASTISLLIDAGLGGDTLKNILAAIETDMMKQKEAFHETFHSVSKSTERVRRFREKHNEIKEKPAFHSVSQPVSYNNTTFLEQEVVKRKTINYPKPFQEFWAAFPTDQGMSKAEAYKAWLKLDPADQEAARLAIPAFKTWISQQGPSYRTVHACRYLSQRRFDGFSQEPERTMFSVKRDSPQGRAWLAYKKSRGEKTTFLETLESFTVPSEYPPQERAAALAETIERLDRGCTGW